jgi:hypothetical protein
VEALNMEKEPGLGRMFQREKDENLTEYRGREKVKIGVAGMSEGAGVTFFTFSAARYIANIKKITPAVVEISDGDEGISGWNYDVIGIDRRFAGRDYHSYHRNIAEGRGVRSISNMDEGINWALRLPSEAGISLDLQQLTSLAGNVAGDVVLCDFSARLNLGLNGEDRRLEGVKRLLKDMSLVVFIVNPAPSKLLGGHRRLAMMKELESGGVKALYVVNMFGKGVNRKELFSYLRPRARAAMDCVPVDELHEAEYNCRNPFQMPGVKKAATGAIEAALTLAFKD